MSTYRAGIIGCGSIAQMHMRGYQGVEAIDVVAIADPVEEVLNEFGECYGIPTRYQDAREMLDAEQLDIVSICTWHKLHAPLTIAACARKPKAILCEKPMATCLGECDQMITAASRNRVKLAIAHQRRFNAAWTDARDLIAAGAIGEPQQIVARGLQGMLNVSSHLVDMMRYVLDKDAQWVIGNLERKTDRYERQTPIEDRSAGVIQFEGGAIGLLLQELAGPYPQGGICYGTEGILDFDERRVRLLSSGSAGWEERPEQGEEDASIAQARELVDWIEGRVEHRGEASNGRAAVEIIMAIYESARRHEVVQIPLKTLASPIELMIESGDLPVERPGPYDIRAGQLRGEDISGPTSA